MPSRKAEITLLATSLKGAPISILFVMLSLDQMFGVKDLQAMTGYSKSAVSAGLSRLEALDIVQQTQRFVGWTLTSKGRQLLLPVSSAMELGKVEGEKKALGSLASSSSYLDLRSSEKATPTSFEDENSALAEENEIDYENGDLSGLPDYESCVTALEVLVEAGVYESVARRRIRQALRGGWTCPVIQEQTQKWVARFETRQARLNFPHGVAAASMVAKCEECHEVAVVDGEDPQRYISGQYGHLIQH